MIANYHTHTHRCNHASGSEREYIEQAIRSGIRILGFSDHSPQFFPGDYYSHFRMRPQEAEDYFCTLTDLKREYAGEIELHIGMEAEYYPALFPQLLDFLRQFPCEYLLLGQHFPGNEEQEIYACVPCADPALLRRYYDQITEGVETGLFTYAAHPDLFYWTGDPAIYRREMARFCRRMKELDCPLEYNLLGLGRKRNYPTPVFWEAAAEAGSTVILGIDAHYPGMLNRHPADGEDWGKTEADARAFLHRLGITPVDQIALRSI